MKEEKNTYPTHIRGGEQNKKVWCGFRLWRERCNRQRGVHENVLNTVLASRGEREGKEGLVDELEARVACEARAKGLFGSKGAG